MGGGNAQKSAMARLKKQQNAGGEAKSQLKVNENAKNVQCNICRQTFLLTIREKAMNEHIEAKHAGKTIKDCFPNCHSPIWSEIHLRKMVSVTSILAALAAAALASAQSCTNPIVRPEWSTLSAAQKALYVSSIQKLAARPSSSENVANPALTNFYDFVNLHARASPWAHGSAEFYPYHRAMMWKFEQAMQSVGWVGGVPYYDWLNVNQNWWTTDVFSSSYFGSATNSDPLNCVSDGPFQKGQFTTAPLDPDVVGYASGVHAQTQCLRRCGATGSVMTYASDWVTRFSATSYAAFRGDILTGDGRDDDFYGFHASGHEVMGGYEGPLVANDPIDPTGSQIATPTQQLDTWGVQVASMLDTKGSNGGPLCYTYGPSGTDSLAMPPVTCPNAPPVVMITDTASNSTSTPVAPSIDSTWTNTMLTSLVKVSLAFGHGLASRDELAVTASPLSSTDDDTTTNDDDVSSTRCTKSTNPDNSTTITFTATSQTVSIPADAKLRHVFNSYVEYWTPNNDLVRVFPEFDGTPYIKIEGAPTNVEAGHPCYEAHPVPMTQMWIQMHQLNEGQIRHSEARVMERIDRENVARCGPVAN
ncbi:hypothetical protein HDU98_003077 [Podochytrium sp. JEL0797]|nr:hypothetical protein HDU98_003077 [Podochytrium sp. JEL0797]